MISRLRGLLTAYPGADVAPQALLLLGQVYLRTEELEAARQAFSEIVERFPDSDEARRAKSLLAKIG